MSFSDLQFVELTLTYIHTSHGFRYLTSAIDPYDRKVIGWSMSSTLTAADTSVRAYRMAVRSRRLQHGNKLPSAEQVDIEIFEYIEIFYNKIRRHSALKNMTIDEFNKLNKIPA